MIYGDIVGIECNSVFTKEEENHRRYAVKRSTVDPRVQYKYILLINSTLRYGTVK